MAQELPIYGILTNVTTENIIARSKQIEFVLEDGTKTDVEDALKNRTQFLTGEEIYNIKLSSPTYDCMMICSRQFTGVVAEDSYETGHIYYYDSASNTILDLTPETGGGGSGGSGVSLQVQFTSGTNISLNEELVIPFFWTSDNNNNGIGYVTCKVDGLSNKRIRMSPGSGVWNAGKLSRGTHTLTMEAVDSVGSSSNRWTATVIVGALEIESSFKDGTILQLGEEFKISYSYYTVNDDPLELLISIDGEEEYVEEIGYSATINGFNETGNHTIQLRLRSNSGSEENPVYTYSNVLKYDVICAEKGVLYLNDLNNTSLSNPFELISGNRFDLRIRVTKLDAKSFTATLNRYIKNSTGAFVEDTDFSSITASWYLGVNTFIITDLKVTEDTEYKYTVTVKDNDDEESASESIDVFVKVVPSDLLTITDVRDESLVLRLKPGDKTNSSENREIWEDTSGNNHVVKLHDFNYSVKSHDELKTQEEIDQNTGNGWARDEEGINRLVINSDAYVEIDYSPFKQEITDGLTIDIEFKTRNILDSTARVLSCFSDKSIGDKRGFWIDTEYATLSNNNSKTEIEVTEEEVTDKILVGRDENGNKIYEDYTYIKYTKTGPFQINFAEDRRTRVTFVISRTTTDDYLFPCMNIFVDGVLTANETIGSTDVSKFMIGAYKIYLGCNNYHDDPTSVPSTNTNIKQTGHCEIYNFRVYNRALSMKEIVQNYVSDIEDPKKQNDQIKRNELSNQVDNSLPVMEFIMTSADYDNITKDNKQPVLINFTNNGRKNESFMYEGTVQWQGTSTLAYAVKNFKIKFAKDSNGEKIKYDLGNGIKENVFTLKADYMDSSNRRNTGMTAYVTNLGTELTPPQQFVPAMRSAIYGFPMKLYLTRTDAAGDAIGREFLGIYNFNLDKGSCDSLGLVTGEDLKDFIYERIPDPTEAQDEVNRFEREYPEYDCLSFEVGANSDISAGAFADPSYESVSTDFEIRFPDEDDITDTTHEGVFEYFRDSNEIKISKLTNESNGVYTLDSANNKLIHSNQYRDYTFSKVESDMSTSVFGEYKLNIDGSDLILELTEVISSEGYFVCTLKETGSQIKKRNYRHLQKLIEWVMDADDETFHRDFEKHFNLSAVTDYYLTVLVCGMVDNLGKNMMLDTYGPVSTVKYDENPEKYTYTEEELAKYDNYIWYPHFYDLDTELGVDNSGNLRFDVDVEVERGSFNTSQSILWTKFSRVFYNEIKERYEQKRTYSESEATYTEESILQYLIDEGIDLIPESTYNTSMFNKYFKNPTYMYMMHGSQREHFRRWVSQRLYFLDSFFEIGSDYNKRITVRVAYNHPDEAKPVIYNIQTFKPSYVTVTYTGANDQEGVTWVKKKVPRNATVEFLGYVSTSTDHETIISCAPNIKDFGDVSIYTPSEVLVGEATKLTSLIVGTDEHPNSNLLKLVLGNNKYLTTLIAKNCTAISTSVDVSGCNNLRVVDVSGSSISTIMFSENGGALNTLALSSYTTTITLKNFVVIENFTIDSKNKLTTLHIENCPKLTGYIDDDGNIVEGKLWSDILNGWEPQSQNMTIIVDGYGLLRNNKFLDRCVELCSNDNLGTTNIQLSGTVRYLGSNIPDKYSFYKTYFPKLTVLYPNVNDFSGMFRNYKNINAIYSREETLYDELTGVTEVVTKYYWTNTKEDKFDSSDLVIGEDGITRRPIAIYNDDDLEEVALEIRERLSPFGTLKNLNGMFEGCAYLGYLKDDTFDGKNLNNANTTNMFYNCQKLKYFEIPETMNKIGDGMFYNCVNVKAYIPETVTSISDTAFFCDILTGGLHPILLFETSDIILTPEQAAQQGFIENLRDCRFNVKKGENGRALQHSTEPVTIYNMYFNQSDNSVKTSTEIPVYLSYFNTTDDEGNDTGIILYSVKSEDTTGDGGTIDTNTFNLKGSVGEIIDPYTNYLNIREVLPGALSHLSKTSISRLAIPPYDANFKANINKSQKLTEFEGSVARMFYKWDISDSYRQGLVSLSKAYMLSSGNKNVNRYLFYGTKLKEVYLQKEILSIDDYAFSNSDLEVFAYETGTQLNYIGEYAFSTAKLEIIDIPNTVTDIGEYAFAFNNNISHLRYSPNMTYIPRGCFRECNTKETTTYTIEGFSNQITEIGNEAFDSSVGLKLFIVPEYQEGQKDNLENYASYFVCDGSKTKAIDYFENLEHIGNYAFRNIPNINKISISPRIGYIGACAFFYGDNTSLNKTIIEWTSDNIEDYSGLEIEHEAFFGREFYWKCKDIEADEYSLLEKTIYIPSTIRLIGAYAFAPYTENTEFPAELDFVLTDAEKIQPGWTSSYVENALRVIYNYAGSKADKRTDVQVDTLYFMLKDNTALLAKLLNQPTFVEIPANVEFNNNQYQLIEIVDEAFIGHDNNLNDIYFESTSKLEKIGARLFTNSKSINNIIVSGNNNLEIPETVYYIGPGIDFKGTSWFINKALDDFVYLNDYCLGYSKNEIELSASNKTIDDNTRVIYDNAFNGENITSIELPTSLEEIGYSAFANCRSLQNIDMSVCRDNLWNIRDKAFMGCSSLNEIKYTANITHIGKECTKDCNSLTKFDFEDGIVLDSDSQPITPYLDALTLMNNTITHLRIPASLGYFFTSSGVGYSDFMTLTKLKYLHLGGIKETIALPEVTEEEKELVTTVQFENGVTYYKLDLSTIYENGYNSNNNDPLVIYTKNSKFDVPAEDYESDINLSSIESYLYDEDDLVRIMMGFSPTGTAKKLTAKKDITLSAVFGNVYRNLRGANRVTIETYTPTK